MGKTVQERNDPAVKVELTVREYYLLREILNTLWIKDFEGSDVALLVGIRDRLEAAANRMWEI